MMRFLMRWYRELLLPYEMWWKIS